VNAYQSAPYRRELPPVVIASLISVHGRVLRRRKNLGNTCCDIMGVSDPRAAGGAVGASREGGRSRPTSLFHLSGMGGKQRRPARAAGCPGRYSTSDCKTA
jgi:hypothetical protein